MKKIMKTNTALKIFVPLVTVLIVLVITATIAMNAFSGVMDNFFGQGELIGSDRAEDAHAEYYDGISDSDIASSKELSYAFASETSAQVVREGAVLLKNEDTLPLKKSSKVVLLGADISLTDALAKSFDVTDKTVNKISSGLTSDGWDDSVVAASSSTAIVTLYRSYGEGNDAKLISADGIRTDLSLSPAELSLLDKACSTFSKVVVLVASSNAMELSALTKGSLYVDPHYGTAHDFSNITAALWISTDAGNDGATSITEILDGTTNPSGRLPDTYIVNHKKDPTYVNNGNYEYSNGSLTDGYKCSGLSAGQTSKTTFVELEEGIYVGYKYYETAAFEAARGNYDGFDYDSEVVFPFGYGLSYTSFTSEYAETPSYNAEAGEFVFRVKVTNTGSVAGKEVVQIYCGLPYESGQVEKAHVQLVGFGKTDILAPGKDEIVEIVVDRDYICSYDYKNEGCYVLDSGKYRFMIAENAHGWTEIADDDAKKCYTYELAGKIVFDENNARSGDKVVAVNRTDDMLNKKFSDQAQSGTGVAVNFSRANFKATFPTTPEGNDFVASQDVLNARKKFNESELASTEVDDFVITGSNATSYVLADMRGLDYDDPKWDSFIQQISLEKLVEMYTNGNWQEVADVDNGIPRTQSLDGPEGLSALAIDTSGCYNYHSQIMLAATWNKELAAKVGNAFAYEMSAYGFTGWYGPGMNIHRSAFCGRNGQYYSEDSMLAGIMAANEVTGASEFGVICYMKHFALNIQETNRDGNLCTWLNEQALREIYLRNWEYYMKNAVMTVKYYGTNASGEEVLLEKEMPAATGVMTSYNLIGATWAGANGQIFNEIVRGEFGFTGIAITDAVNTMTEYMDCTHGLYSGVTDLCLSQNKIRNYDNDYAIIQLQRAAKNVLYNKANSNCLQINDILPGQVFSYGISPWRLGLIIAWIIVSVIVVASAVFVTFVIVSNNKNEE